MNDSYGLAHLVRINSLPMSELSKKKTTSKKKKKAKPTFLHAHITGKKISPNTPLEQQQVTMPVD